ncbi:MAG: PrsW family glutamic-type intramembrane protease, partial [Saprospiraceae bacterium]
VFAVVMGYFAGLAKFNPDKRFLLLAQGFGMAILLHGAYDALIIQRWSDWLLVLATLALYLSLYFCSRLVQIHLENSPFRNAE